MRMFENGIAKNFGLVGRNVRRYLATTALTGAGLLALATPALADNWTDHTATEGSINIDTSVPNTTNITQNTNFVKVQGDGDINAGWTVNVAQPSNSSKYVLYDTEGDPTKIMGNLNANGKIYIFDKNGVIFGEGAQVNVGSITASTGTISDENIKADRLVFENVGGNSVVGGAGSNTGAVINNGTITVADAGLAAFVAPTVVNNGMIAARAGKVVLASGEKVTLDLYGDKLVEIEAGGALKNALVENNGTIAAHGGTVVLSAQAAKNAVDGVINMNGIIDVASVSAENGKVVLGSTARTPGKVVLDGGSKGTVKVAGTIKSGNNGDIKVTGQRLAVTKAAKIINGAGSKTYLNGTSKTDFAGTMTTGKNSTAEISGNELALAGHFDLGDYTHLIFDPAVFNIDTGAASAIVSALNAVGAVVDVQATNRINLNADIDSSAQATNSVLNFKDQDANGTLRVDLNAKIRLGAAQTLSGDASVVNVANTGLIQNGIGVAATGATVNVAAGTYNESVLVNKTVNLRGARAGTAGWAAGRGVGESIINTGTSGILVTANNATVDGFEITGATNGVTVDGASNVAVQNNYIHDVAGQGIQYLNAPNGNIYRNLVANTGGNGIFLSNADDGRIGLNFVNDVQGYSGILVENSDRVAIGIYNVGTNRGTNRVNNAANHGITVVGGTGNAVYFNTVDGANANGIQALGGSDLQIMGNWVRNGAGRTDIGIYATGGTGINATNNWVADVIQGINFAGLTGTGNDIYGNIVSRTSGDGITGSGVANLRILRNTVSGGTADGIYVTASNRAIVQGNAIANLSGGGANDNSGIFINGSNDVLVDANTISNIAWDGIKIEGGARGTVSNNVVDDVDRVGIYAGNASNLRVTGNTVSNTTFGIGSPYGGISTDFGSNITISGNTVTDSVQGIRVNAATGTNLVDGNIVDDVTGDGIYVADTTRASVTRNTVADTGGNGILLVRSNGARINRNTVDNAAGASGIYVLDSNGVAVGIYNLANRGTNIVTNSANNGITVEGGTGNAVYYSTVNGAGRYGIEGINSADLNIFGNWVRFGTGLTDAGIYAHGGTGNTAVNNWVDDVIAGIVFEDLTGTGNAVYGNTIKRTSGDSVIADNVLDLAVQNNRIFDGGANGIAVSASDAALVSGNTITTTAGSGIVASDVDDLTVTGNTVSGAANGLYLSGGANGTVVVSANTFTGNAVGARFESGLIDLTGPGNSFINGGIGMYFEAFGGNTLLLRLVDNDGIAGYETFPGVTSPVNYGGTIGAQTFQGQLGEFVFLAANTFVDPVSGDAIWLDGQNSSYFFDGEGAAFTPAVDGLNAGRVGFLEDKFEHRLDTTGRGIFWFGFFDSSTPVTTALIAQEDLFNTFDSFNGDLTGLNVRITGLPRLPGQGPATGGLAQNLNTIETFAGGATEGNPSALNAIETAAGGPDSTASDSTQSELANIETEAGGENDNASCWSDAATIASGGQAVNVVYGGSLNDSLNQAATCGTSF